ncbi:MAG: peroxiredoxin [Deltaproteobacteria bacterium]|nr:peroxiredoxin [Deltaproteobacteria bacterium]
MSEARVQGDAPEFTAQAVMPNGEMKEVSLSDYKGKYVLLFFYPLDFTFVCPTEIISFSDRIKEFEERGVQVLGVSVDSHFSHAAWRGTDRKKGGIGDVTYPLIADLDKSISTNYGVLLEKPGIALRGAFLLDKDHKVRHVTINDLPLGRSIDEFLRLADALQFTEEHGEVCPANWNKGDDAMKPNQDGLESYSKSHF